MSTGAAERFQAILHECDVHARRLTHARKVCGEYFPLTPTTYSELSEDAITRIDQLVYRFTKLQDALGAKLFPMIVAQLREDADSLTVLDKLHELEKARAITDADRWQELREIRNQLTHDYEDDAEAAANYLQDRFLRSETLIEYKNQAANFVNERVLPALV